MSVQTKHSHGGWIDAVREAEKVAVERGAGKVSGGSITQAHASQNQCVHHAVFCRLIPVLGLAEICGWDRCTRHEDHRPLEGIARHTGGGAGPRCVSVSHEAQIPLFCEIYMHCAHGVTYFTENLDTWLPCPGRTHTVYISDRAV